MKEEILDNDLEEYTPEEQNIYDQGYNDGRERGDRVGLAYILLMCIFAFLCFGLVAAVKYFF